MPIDFTQLHGKPSVKPPEGTPNLAKLLSGLSLKLGQSVAAQVTSVRALSLQERSFLQSQATAKASAEPLPTKPQAAPSSSVTVKPALASSLLSQPALRLINVAIQARQVALLSSLPVTKGDAVLVTRAGPQQLVIASENGKPIAPGSNTTHLEAAKAAGAERVAPAPLPNTSALNATATRATAAEPAALNQTLREIIPRLHSSSIEQQTQPLQQLIKLLPRNKLTAGIDSALKDLAKLSLSTEQIKQTPRDSLGAQAKQLINNSGSFFESNLAKTQTASPSSNLNLLLGSDRKAILLKLAHLVASNMPGLQNQGPMMNTASKGRPQPQPQPQPQPNTDAISQIVRNLQSTHTAGHPPLPGVAPPSTTTSLGASSGPIPGSTTSVKPELLDIRQLTPSLSQALLYGGTARISTADSATLQTQLILLTHQLTLNSLAKIRGQQVGADTATLRAGEPASPGSHFSVDLPVRWGEHTDHARISFEEQENEPQPDSPSTARSWLVKLHINTDAIGDLYIHMRYFNEQIGLGIWAQNNKILDEAKTKLDTVSKAMKSAGVILSNVNYYQGKPAGRANELSYNLVDVKT
ncbi:hypothetical protein QWI17_06965 [Gilvimarinus sp. SDUM040013]|uniref:Flagellar hook-length control protein-like C-terminal domain-containing protein n=1 Tax=Gilvimarinus gilvus TaxID=3058038 RepID=A0ABU4S1W0_9GAMM|nr:hypothetical protein [Gilvimarinus sp. SDUM040013]MDO3385575.1 hypothetical protein [Gilvimarinus sp. SDUM040013]MDX6851174.1 hypothetical protein [Gilvimarinus sp. SDUM040013]